MHDNYVKIKKNVERTLGTRERVLHIVKYNLRKQLRDKMLERIRELFYFISSVFYINQDVFIYRLTKMDGRGMNKK